jgi:hypothetical protein
VALQQGWRVIVGSKALINRSSWRLPLGVNLCQTMTHKRVPLLKHLRKLGYATFGWDEEGLICLNREGSSIPWLLAADALVHNNCTTAVEAAVIGLTPICYCPVLSLEDEAGLPNPISHRAYSLREMHAAITLSELKMLKPTAAQVQLLNAYVSGLAGPLASEAIMQHLASLDVSPVSASAVWGAKFFGAARVLFKRLRRDHITDRYLKKVFPPVSADTVATRANQIAEALKMDRKISVVERSTNIFELSLV